MTGSFANKPSQSGAYFSLASMTTTTTTTFALTEIPLKLSAQSTFVFIPTVTNSSINTTVLSSNIISNNNQNRREMVSKGALAGIVVGSICGIFMILTGTFFLVYYCKRNVNKRPRRSPRASASTLPAETSLSNFNTIIQQFQKSPSSSVIPPFVQDQEYVVRTTYSQTLRDELYIQPGDHVKVLMSYDDGWCLGINLTSGKEGVVPRRCLQ